ncbi:MAG: hypothetical protein LBS55_01860 [Prevotellaceae bacterium]|nr:hypothetical protein [Prevotellaceae bacterium]
MKNLIGLITLFSIAVGNAHSQVKMEQSIVFDTVFNDGGYFHFHMNNTQIGFPSNKSNQNNFNSVSIINRAESERQRLVEEERRAIEYYIDSMKIVLFTNTMGLTKSEGTVFWPEYENYQNKLDKIREKRRDANAKLCDPFRKYKIKEYLAFVDIEVKTYRDEALLREQYFEKFKTILGDKFYLFYRAEYLFMRWIYSNF